jgi:hypothetical protein
MVKKDEDLFFSSIFTYRASRRLSSAALLRVRNSNTMASPLNAWQMKASNSCKIQVVKKHSTKDRVSKWE